MNVTKQYIKDLEERGHKYLRGELTHKEFFDGNRKADKDFAKAIRRASLCTDLLFLSLVALSALCSLLFK